MNQTQYNAIEGVNWSHLKWMRTSPKHYQYHLTAPVPDTGLMRIGRAIHCLALEPEQFGARYPVYEGKVRRGKAWDAFVEDHPDTDKNDILIESEMARAQGAGKAVLLSPAYSKHLDAGQHEVVLEWTDPDTGIKCKGRADGINGRVVEVKSASDISGIDRDAAKMGWHGQSPYYHDGAIVSGLMPAEAIPPVIIVVESTPPHAVVVVDMLEYPLEIGRRLYKRLLHKVAECTESGIWPGPPDREMVLPEWAENEANGDEEDITIGGVPITEGVQK